MAEKKKKKVQLQCNTATFHEISVAILMRGEREDLLLLLFHLLVSFLLVYVPGAVDALGLQGFFQTLLLPFFLQGVCFGSALSDP